MPGPDKGLQLTLCIFARGEDQPGVTRVVVRGWKETAGRGGDESKLRTSFGWFSWEDEIPGCSLCWNRSLFVYLCVSICGEFESFCWLEG